MATVEDLAAQVDGLEEELNEVVERMDDLEIIVRDAKYLYDHNAFTALHQAEFFAKVGTLLNSLSDPPA